MSKRYVLFATLPYAYSILRPLQAEIRARGDEVAWFLEPECENLLEDTEVLLESIDDVKRYSPLAIFACGNYIYPFLPGIKVAVFHGYAVGKRGEKGEVLDDHFTIRNWFDIYCTQGPSSTPVFEQLEKKHGFFKCYETGWCKVDPFFTEPALQNRGKTTILYSPTFSKGITSVDTLYDTIRQIAERRDWQWIITFHPKINDRTIIDKYKALAEKSDNVSFERNEGLITMQRADVMLCDSSSIILEFMLLNKPVVTFNNTNPGRHLLDVSNCSDVEPALDEALTKPESLMEAINNYTWKHEAHRDGHNCARVLDAVDDFKANHENQIKAKPINLIRKLKLRKKLKYWK